MSLFVRLLAVLVIVLIGAASLVPGPWQIRTGLPEQLEHFLAYFAAGLVLPAAFPKWRTSRTWLVLLGLGGMLEAAQALVPGRSARLADFAASAAGVIVAAAAFTLFRTLRPPERDP